MGIIFAFIALLSWGLGDFLIQKGTRKFGNWVTLFYITGLLSFFLLPFIYHDLVALLLLADKNSLFILFFTSIIFLISALFNFEALKRGKISVVEPIYALEVPLTAILAAVIIREYLNFWQVVLIISLIIGIALLSIKSFSDFKKIKLEKGVWYAILATLAMGVVNFIFGVSARQTSPLLVNWFASFFMFIASFTYLAYQKRLKEISIGWVKNKRLILGVGFADNLAWIAYAYSTLFIPIAIAISISESYVALAAGLGLIFNKEKLKAHQFAGLAIAIISVIILARITTSF